MTDDQKNDNPANSTDMTKKQATMNNLQGPGRGARPEPGAEHNPERTQENVKTDARGDMPDIPDMDKANQADQE